MTKDQQSKLSGAMVELTALTIELAYQDAIGAGDGPMLDDAAASFEKLAELFRTFALAASQK